MRNINEKFSHLNFNRKNADAGVGNCFCDTTCHLKQTIMFITIKIKHSNYKTKGWLEILIKKIIKQTSW